MNIKVLFSVVSLFATSFIPTLAQEVYTDNQGVEYTQTGATTCVVSGASESLQANITIPSTINGWTVTGINEYAFDGILNVPDVLKTVVIADGITNIGECAFSSQTSLSTVTLPEGLVIIPTGLFSDCFSLSTFNIPSTVTVIRPAAFQGIGSNFKSVTIPVSVQTICSQAFCTDPNTVDQVTFYCESTTPPNVDVRTQDNKLTTYWYEGSSFCSSNKYGRLVVPNGAKTAYEASNWKNSFTEIVEEAIVSSEKIDGIYYNLKKYSRTAEVKSNPNKYTGEVVIPSSVTYNNETYRVTGIDDQAFYQCTELTGLTIPASITYIGKTSSPGSADVFRNCIENVFEKVYISDLAAWCRITFADDFYANPLSVAHHLYLNSSEITELVIPNTITSLGTFQFASCHGITSVTIPESVTNVGLATFYDCRNLASVNIPSSITSIGVNMFNGCDRLSSVTIPNSITTIEHGAFIQTGLTTVRIPSSVTTIGYSAFSELSSLVIEKNTPLAIADNTFTNRTNTDLIVPVGCVAAYQAADYWKDFKTISANTPAQEFTDEQGVKYTQIASESTYTVSGHTDACTGAIIIPATVNGLSVTSIGKDAFQCSNITSVRILEGVTTIGEGAFGYCPYLTSVIIPASVTSISGNIFRSCNNLESILVEAGNTKYDSRNNCNAIIDKVNNTLISGCKNTVIPENVTSIGAFAFHGLSSLTSITIPNSVTSIGEWALGYCDGLTSLTIPASLVDLGTNDPFTACSSLESIVVEKGNPKFDSRNDCNAIIEKSTNSLLLGCKNTIIPNDVTSIGNRAFDSCKGLISLTIPASVTSIGYWAFIHCTGLTDLYCLAAAVPTTNGDPNYPDPFVESNISNATLHVPAGSVDAYKAASPWSGFKEVKAIETKKTINVETAGTLSTLIPLGEKYLVEELTLTGNLNGDDLALLRDMAGSNYNGFPTDGKLSFLDMSGATIVAGGKYVELVDENIYYNREIGNFHGGFDKDPQVSEANTLGKNVFAGCSKLETMIMPTGVVTVGERAFSDTSLKDIVWPTSLATIGYEAFFGCKFTSFTLPASVESVGGNILKYCSTLELSVESGNSNYDSRDNCNAIIETSTNTLIGGCKKTIIPNSVTSIGVEAFCGCASGLLSLTIPSSVTSIGYDAFEACSDLVHVYCNAEVVPTTDADAFKNVDIGRYVTLHVPAGSVEAYQAAAPWNGFNKVVALSTNIPDVEIQGIYYNLNEETLTAEVTKNPNGPYSGDLIVGGGIWYDSRLYSVTSIGKDAFALNGGITSVSIQEGVTTIGEGAFGYCPYLTSVTFPSSLISIGEAAFYGCERLTSVTIPASVTSISGNIFGSCNNLESIQVEAGNTKYDSRNNCNAIIDKVNNTLISGCKNTVIPENVTSIGAFAFHGLSSLTSITIPNSVTSIGEWALGYCDGLTSLTIPASLVDLGTNDPFTACSSLESIVVEKGNPKFDSRNDCNAIIEKSTNSLLLGCKNTIIPNDVTSIGNRAFDSCKGLISLTIPASVTSIGYWAFIHCTGLTDLYCLAAAVPTTNGDPNYPDPFVESNISNATLHVPAGSVDLYMAADYWKDFKSIVGDASIELSPFTGADLWAGYVSEADFALPSGLTAYTITALGNNTSTATSLDYIPKNVPILLKRSDSSVNSFNLIAGTGTAPTTNLLKVYNTDKILTNREGYVLFKDEFVLVNEGTLPAGRIFLPLNGGDAAKTRGIVIEGEGTTGVHSSMREVDDANDQWYDLQGRRLEGKPIKKGLYILNGRKVVVK